MTVGDTSDENSFFYGGRCFEFLSQVSLYVQNLISRDPQSLFCVCEGHNESYFEMIMKFIQKVLIINSKGSIKQCGVVILRVLISLLENLPGQLNSALPDILAMILPEIEVSF